MTKKRKNIPKKNFTVKIVPLRKEKLSSLLKKKPEPPTKKLKPDSCSPRSKDSSAEEDDNLFSRMAADDLFPLVSDAALQSLQVASDVQWIKKGGTADHVRSKMKILRIPLPALEQSGRPASVCDSENRVQIEDAMQQSELSTACASPVESSAESPEIFACAPCDQVQSSVPPPATPPLPVSSLEPSGSHENSTVVASLPGSTDLVSHDVPAVVSAPSSVGSCSSILQSLAKQIVSSVPENIASATPPDPEVSMRDSDPNVLRRQPYASLPAQTPHPVGGSPSVVCPTSCDSITNPSVGSLPGPIHVTESQTVPGADLSALALPPQYQSVVSAQQVSAVNSMVTPEGSIPVSCYSKFPDVSFNFWNALLCSYCGFPKTCEEELEAHIAGDHWRWTPYQCCYCPGVQRATQFALQLHLKEVHPGLPEKIICSLDDQKTALLQQEILKSRQCLLQYRSYVLTIQNLQQSASSATSSSSGGLASDFAVASTMNSDSVCQISVGGAQSSSSTSRNQEESRRVEDEIIVIDEPAEEPTSYIDPHSVSVPSQAPNSVVQNLVSFADSSHAIPDSRVSASSASFVPPSFLSGFSTNTTLHGKNLLSEARTAQERQAKLQQQVHQSSLQSQTHQSSRNKSSIRRHGASKGRSGRSQGSQQIQCQECSDLVDWKQEMVHAHVYGHMFRNGLGYRYICADCGFGSIRKTELFLHNKTSHQRVVGGKHKDRSQELAEMFFQTRLICFPNYETDAASWSLVCGLCNQQVDSSKKNKHIYRKHLKEDTTKCGYCDFSVCYSNEDMRKHIRNSHPDLLYKTVDLKRKSYEKMGMMREQCFGQLSSEPPMSTDGSGDTRVNIPHFSQFKMADEEGNVGVMEEEEDCDPWDEMTKIELVSEFDRQR